MTVEATASQSQSVAPADVQPYRRRGGDGGKYRLSVCRRFKAARLARRAEAQIHRKRLHVVGGGTWFFYADTDQMGVVYYGNYLTLFERARNELMRACGYTYRHCEAE